MRRGDARPRFRDKTNHKPRFIKDWREHCRPVDREQRARIMALAKALERRTKKPGRRNGQLGHVGLEVLEALLFGFLNCATGLLCPSYEAVRKRTGLCRQSVQNGLARLERCGIIKIAARLCKQWVERVSPVTGLPERYRGTTQATNLYSVHPPGAWAQHLKLPAGRKTPFPSPRLMRALLGGGLQWRTSLELSPPNREEPPAPGVQNSNALAVVG